MILHDGLIAGFLEQRAPPLANCCSYQYFPCLGKRCAWNGDRTVKTRLGIISLLCALLGVLSTATGAFAWSSPITLSGSFEHRTGPGSGASAVELSVDATLLGASALGTLDYAKKGERDWLRFHGTVTCVLVDSQGVSVGAVGKEEEEPTDGPPETKVLPGTYTELLTAGFGEIANGYEEYGPPLTSTYHIQEGPDEGAPDGGRPRCAKASFAEQWGVPVPYGLTLTPTILSPEAGYVAPTKAVTFRGIAEAGRVVELIEGGQTTRVAKATAAANGRWHIHLTDPNFGARSFHTRMEADPANVSSIVEIHIPTT
jgi:hypothetical protein